jgi:sensor domain CHASE-containing protein
MSTTLQPLPNPFLHSQAGTRPRRPSQFAAQPALVGFLVCLVLGLVIVAWRAKTRANDARARAGLEALARGSAVEVQFGQVVSAAEVLGALARQHGGAIPDFQRLATELLAARPGLASLELQPGGVVSDIAPRTAYARVIGLNVLNHPTYRPGALATIQRRALTVTGPLTLYTGEPGIVARVPVFQRDRDGRDAFWGFVAASMRVSEALRRAQVDDLVRHGYNYAFAAPASGRAQGSTIAAHGSLSAPSAVQQPVRAQNVEFRLLLQPRGGWVNKTKLVLEVLGVLVASGLVCLLVNLLESRRAVELALADANQRLARESEDRKRAQEDYRAVKDEAAAAQAELSRTRSALQSSSELEIKLNVSVRAAEAAAQAAQAELEQARMARQQSEQTIESLQSRLRAAAQAKKEREEAPPTPPQVEQPSIADTPVPLDAATPVTEQSAEPSPASVSEARGAHQEPSAPPAVNDTVPSSSVPAPEPVPTPVTTPEPESPALAIPPETLATAAVLPPAPVAEKKPTRAPRRKKARRNNQMDFFAPPPAAEPAAATPPAQPVAEKPAVEASSLPTAEPLPPTPASEAGEPEKPAPDAPDRTLAEPKPKDSKPARPLPARPPLDPAQLRKAVNLILPLFTGRDPGARDCLKDNRTTFRSAFAPEAYVEFEESVKSGDFDAALEHLKKAAKRNGIPV